MLEVRKLGSSILRISFVKSDLANFLLFLPLLPTTSLLSILVAGRAPAGYGLVFNMDVSGAVILLKPWMKRQ